MSVSSSLHPSLTSLYPLNFLRNQIPSFFPHQQVLLPLTLPQTPHLEGLRRRLLTAGAS
ncbi:hypothetical protein LINPERPRIM_LOCUS14726 [Linum perenne]